MKSESQNIVIEIKAANSELASRISAGIASEFKEVRKEIAGNESDIRVLENELETVKSRDSCHAVDKHVSTCPMRGSGFTSQSIPWGNVLKFASVVVPLAIGMTLAIIKNT